MSEEAVRTEARDGILVITIDRPHARNAVSLAVTNELSRALDRLDEEATLRVGVLTGADGNFCAGMDLKEFAQGVRPSIPGRGFGGLTERPPRKPLLAAVEGYALGGGCELALACDLVVAARDAWFGLPEVTHGLVPAGGGILRLPAKVPANVANEWILTGSRFPADRAFEIGLVNRLTETGGALAGALEIADRIAANAPEALIAAKHLLRVSRTWTADEAFDRQRPFSDAVFSSPDAREGANAFAQGRHPRWSS